jgi:hypothetical protein
MGTDFFPGFPDDARLWVIALESASAGATAGNLDMGLGEILGIWRHKGHAYEAAWEVLEDRLILVVEPGMAKDPSGCAIDGMLRKVHQLAARLGRKTLGEDRILVRLGGQLQALPRSELGERIADGTLQGDTPVLDLALHNLRQLREGRLERALAHTWIGRKFKLAVEAGT